MVKKVTKGEVYTCKVCNCKLEAKKSGEGDCNCNLSCCGQAMVKCKECA